MVNSIAMQQQSKCFLCGPITGFIKPVIKLLFSSSVWSDGVISYEVIKLLIIEGNSISYGISIE
jgi:hypothetical protein